MTLIKLSVSVIMTSLAVGLLVIAAQAQSDACSQGYVWREAFAGDHVCVTPKARQQAANDNSQARARREPGEYNCRPGYVWRVARPSDLVCVTPYIRALTASENRQAENNRAGGVYDRLRDEHPYLEPRWEGSGGNRLDWCLNWGTQCGKPAADRFCNRRLYIGARDFEADPDVGSYQTTVSGTDEVCNESFCTGFAYIICYGRLTEASQSSSSYDARLYKNPSLDGYRLDECYYWDTGCGGKKVADAYCREYEPAKGFSRSLYYRLDATPSDVNTITIGTGEVCDNHCTGFQVIICQ